MFLDIFCNKKCQEIGETTKSLEQGIFFFFKQYCCFSCFLTFFCNQKCLETGEMTKSLENNDFLKGFGRFSCFQTLLNPESVYKQEKWQNPLTIMIFSKDLVVFPVSRHFWKVKVSGNRETPKSLEYGKRLETGKKQNPLNTKSVWKQGNSKFLWTRKSV